MFRGRTKLALFIPAALLLLSCAQSGGGPEGGAEAGPDGAEGDLIPIEMADTPAITTGGVLMVASGAGLDEEAGVSLERATYASSAAQGEAIAAGGHAMGHIADSTFAALYDAGVPIKVLSQSVDSSRQIQLVAREDLGIESPQDLEGLTIGLPFGSAADSLLNQLLDQYGVDASTIQTVDLTPPDVVTTYAQGDIDAYVTWPPALIQAQREVPSTVLHDSQESYFPADPGPDQIVGTHILVWATEEFIDSNPEAIQRYFDMSRRSIEFINDPETRPEAIDIMAETLDVDRDIVEQTVEEWITYQMQIDDFLIENLTSTATFLHENGTLPGAAPESLSEWFNLEPLEQFDESLIQYEW